MFGFSKKKIWFYIFFFFGIFLAVSVNGDEDTKIDLDVRDADLRQVLMSLAAKAKINLLLSPKVRGTLTCRVSDISAMELIEFIAKCNGYVIEKHGNILLVLGEQSPGSRVRFEIIPLMNANAAELEKIIQNLKLDKRTKVTHDARTNRLIVVYEY